MRTTSHRVSPRKTENAVFNNADILGHVDAEDYTSLTSLLGTPGYQIKEDAEGKILEAVMTLFTSEKPDLAKEVINKIDTKSLAKQHHFEFLWGFGNNRFVEIFEHMIDRGFDPSATSENGDVFHEVTKQSSVAGHPCYEADYRMTKKMLETGKIIGFTEEESLRDALKTLDEQGPRSLRRKPVITDHSYAANATFDNSITARVSDKKIGEELKMISPQSPAGLKAQKYTKVSEGREHEAEGDNGFASDKKSTGGCCVIS